MGDDAKPVADKPAASAPVEEKSEPKAEEPVAEAPEAAQAPAPKPKPAPAPAKPTMTKARSRPSAQLRPTSTTWRSVQGPDRPAVIRGGSGFSKADATFAVAHVKVNWNEQAAEAAQSIPGLQPLLPLGSDRPVEVRGRIGLHPDAGGVRRGEGWPLSRRVRVGPRLGRDRTRLRPWRRGTARATDTVERRAEAHQREPRRTQREPRRTQGAAGPRQRSPASGDRCRT